jgi:hypothetical protein
MERRTFLRNGLASVGAALAAVFLPSSASAAALYSESFGRAPTSAGWGKPWFNQRRGIKWGIAKKKAFFQLPEPQVGAGRHNPNPVVLLDRDVVDADVKARLSTSNSAARFGLMARVGGYGDYYAAYLEDSKIRLSKFGLGREKELKSASFQVRAGTGYWLRLNVAGTDPVQLKAKAWKVGQREPSVWTIFGQEDATEEPLVRRGATGFVFLHDDIRHRPARIQVDNFSVRSTEVAKKTMPEITFAFAGRTLAGTGGLRTQVVAKTDIPASVSFEVGSDANLKNPTVVKPTEVDTRALTSKAFLNGLAQSDTVYWRVVATSKSGRKYRGRIRSFQTPPSAGDNVSFCFGSCSKSFANNVAFATAAGLDPFFFVHLGDLGYPESALSGGGSLALTTGSFQDRWTRMLAPRSITELHRETAWIMLQDDHDYGRDNAWRDTVRPFTIPAFDALSGNLNDRSFDLRYGDVHSFFIDARVHSDDPEGSDGPAHSLIGATQKEWLKDSMRSSDAPLLCVFSGQPLWGGGDGLFSWKRSFATERKELLSFFHEVQGPARRVIVLSGNAHAHYVNRFSEPDKKDVIEFVSSGMDRRETTGARPLDDDGIIDPLRSIKSVDGFGYVSYKATGTPQVELRAVDSTTGADIWPGLTLDI